MVSLTVWLALPAAARTLTVGAAGADYRRIADAVRDANDGDTIEVAAGAYTEAAVSVDVDVEIVGTAGSGATTWTGPNNDPPLRVQSGTTVTVEGFTLVGRGGVVVIRTEGSTLTLRDLVVSGNRAPSQGDGSALYAARTTLTIESSRFTNNQAADGRGGHLFVTEGTTTVTDTTFEGGLADRGGAVMLDNVDATFTDCTFSTNEAVAGGAITAFDGELTLDNVAFERNRAEGGGGFGQPPGGDGGALFLDGDVVLAVTGSTFEGNTAVSTAGAIRMVARSRGSVDTTRLSDNTANFGGAVYVAGTARLSATGSLFTHNDALDGNGGAIRVRSDGAGVELELDGCQLDENSATQAGGAVAVAAGGGGAGPAVDVRSTSFSGNEAADGGALLATGASDLQIGTAMFCTNRATGDGGAVQLGDNTGGQRMTNVAWIENRADGRGGGLHLSGDRSAEVLNGSFLGDSATQGGAIYVDGSDVRVENTLVAFTVAGDGIAGTSTGSSVSWSDFWQNTATDFPPAMGGAGNLAADPVLEAYTRDGDCADDRIWPRLGSPLIDAGNPAVSDLDGSRSDIGAYGGPSAAWDELVDGDGDGVLGTVDCDDGDRDVHPGADEVCDGVDQDCDGAIDEDPVDGAAWFPDGDGDGFGTGDAQTACAPPEGSASEGGDCDDGDPDAHPGATEICDGADQDCDGAVDEDGASPWWPDADGDGFGDEDASPVQACGGDGLAPEGTDCDDGDAAVFPGADDPEGDGVDADCDGADGASVVDGKLKVTSGCAGCDGAGVSPTAALGGLALLLVRRRIARPENPPTPSSRV